MTVKLHEILCLISKEGETDSVFRYFHILFLNWKMKVLLEQICCFKISYMQVIQLGADGGKYKKVVSFIV